MSHEQQLAQILFRGRGKDQKPDQNTQKIGPLSIVNNY